MALHRDYDCFENGHHAASSTIETNAMNVLSIQSHVAYGHVGNAAAVFALQRRGYDVWPLHTLQYSNHPGYDSWSGRLHAPEDIAELIDGLDRLGVLASCDAVLSGYLGSAAMGAAALDAVARVRTQNPRALYLCDPVMGDKDSGRYVADELPAFFSDTALPAADIVTPNLFELEVLSGGRIDTLSQAIAAAGVLLARGPSVVVVTSLRHAESRPDEIEMLAVTPSAAWRVATPRLQFPTAPNGAGDAVAALFLANWLDRHDAGEALAQAAAAIFAVLEKSHATGSRELQLIAAQDALCSPPRRFTAERLEL